MEKEEIARNEQFLLFPQCFLLDQKIVSPFVNIFDIVSLLAAELEEPESCIRGIELTLYHAILNSSEPLRVSELTGSNFDCLSCPCTNAFSNVGLNIE